MAGLGPPPVSQRFNQQCECRGMLAAAGIIKMESREGCAPVRQHAHQASLARMGEHTILRNEGEAETIQCSLKTQGSTIKRQLAFNPHLQFAPAFLELPGIQTTAGGKPPTPSRAVHSMAMLRTLISYYVEIGGPGAGQLREMLSAMRFEKPSARTQIIPYQQVNSIVTKAEELGFRSIAITTLAQYELIERRAHIIGQWDGRTWGDGWIWESISTEWVISYYQTKKGRVLREFDLKPVQRLLGLLQLTPRG